MGVKVKTIKDNVPNMIKQINSLNGAKINVGCLSGEHAWLASIHEFGCNITPKNAKFLTVPINAKAKGKRAADFPDIFFVEAKSGEKFLAIPKGKDDMEILFWLTKSVKIPERAFLRKGYDDNIDEVLKQASLLTPLVISGELKSDYLYQMIGDLMAGKIKSYARNLTDPKNGGATTSTKGSSNPLVDTGGMINSIDFEVVK